MKLLWVCFQKKIKIQLYCLFIIISEYSIKWPEFASDDFVNKASYDVFLQVYDQRKRYVTYVERSLVKKV